MLYVVIFIGVLAALYALVKGRSKMPPATPAVVAAASGAKVDAVGSKLLSTLVTLKNYGMTHLAGLVENVWTGNKAAIEQGVILEAEHLAQGGPALVLSDLESAFQTMLVKKLADGAEAQKIVDTIVAKLGLSHPALAGLVQSASPQKPVVGGPIIAAGK